MSYALTATRGNQTHVYASRQLTREAAMKVRDDIEFLSRSPERTHRWRDPWMIEGYFDLRWIKTAFKTMKLVRVSVVDRRLWCLWESA